MTAVARGHDERAGHQLGVRIDPRGLREFPGHRVLVRWTGTCTCGRIGTGKGRVRGHVKFVGADHGDVPFSVIVVHSQPGIGPKIHRHPYAEIFIVESGTATFRIGDETIVVQGGNVVVSPPGEAHGFTNTGTGELRVTAIHGADLEALLRDHAAPTAVRTGLVDDDAPAFDSAD
jgi:mannose-6-phosphate isomerase-like protein (cupin superfamily)